MSEEDLPPIQASHGGAPIPFRRPSRRRDGRLRIKKLRLLAIVLGLSVIALVSTVFGMMMAVASDLPGLENRQTGENSVLLDVRGRSMGILTGADNRILLDQDQVPPIMKHAIIAVEDKRFYSNSGVDIRGIGRAFVSDVQRKRAVQGASTIAQQFVKNALQAQHRRTVFQKLREAALAYHLTRRWSKDKILTQYLNAIYFGNGAYGLESAAHTYFGHDVNHEGCGTLRRLCAPELKPFEAALLAGMVASPSAYDPTAHPQAARARRNLVLADMAAQRFIAPAEYRSDVLEPLPGTREIQPPQVKVSVPSAAYFTTWIRQQLVDRYGPQTAFAGGLKIRSTLDLDLQDRAAQAITSHLADPSGPTASLVAIDNQTGEVRAMIGGRDYAAAPFNLATQGQRQPGSSFKAFVLAEALRRGISPDSQWPSQKRVFAVPGGGQFVVQNDESNYVGTSTLARATTFSDNSVFAAVGIQAGVGRIANLAERMGIRTPVSHNYAITLGGLKEGVTPLDMAHAYETLAHRGQRVTGSLAAPGDGPVGIREVDNLPRVGSERNQPRLIRVLPPDLADTETSILQTVIQQGTGTAADIGEFAAGKTGTTENYGDAWFVGWNSRLTVAVWVGYPDRVKSMRSDYQGGPVMGGTYPAQIWHDFMTSAVGIYNQRQGGQGSGSATSSGGGSASGTSTSTSTTPSSGAPASSGSGSSRSPTSPGVTSAPAPRTPPSSSPSSGSSHPAPVPVPAHQNSPAPVPTPASPPPRSSPPSSGGGGGPSSSGSGGAGAAGGTGAPSAGGR